MKNKLNLENVEWGEFKIGELFDIKKVYGLPMEKYNSGKTPYISTSTINNGLVNFVSGTEKDISLKNVISIDPIAGKTFYHDYNFIGRGFSGASINLLYNENINKFSALFICNMIEKISKEKASYGNLFNSYRLKGAKILLPKTSDGNPDWEFMENYMKQIENEKLEKIISYYKQKCIQNDLTLSLSLSLSRLDNNQKYWKEFEIGEIFEVSGTTTTHPSILEKGGKIPRITCSATDNGFDDTYKNSATEEGGVLTVDSATIGFVSFQEKDFIATDHVEKIFLKNNQKMSRYLGLFLKTIISNSTFGKYGYGYKFSQIRIKKQKILLPVDDLGNPDFLYMENYMKKIEEKTLKEVIEYFEKRLKNFQNLAGGGYSIDNLEWGEFKIKNLFEIENGKCSKVSGIGEGKIPYIGATNRNNGVLSFIENKNKMLSEGKSIVFICDGEGSMGYSIYKEENFIATTTVKIGKNKNLNKYIGNFIVTISNINRGKYNFGYKRNEERLKNETILLPKTSDGNPDWNFMENYMRFQEQKLILEYLKSMKN